MNDAPTIKRIGAFTIDFLIACIFQSMLMMPLILIPLIKNAIEPADVVSRNLQITLVVFLYFLLRDTPNGQSIGKRVFSLQVRDNKGSPSNIYQRILRNVFLWIWPVELIVFLSTRNKKRLGDIVAHTMIYEITEPKEIPTSKSMTIIG